MRVNTYLVLSEIVGQVSNHHLGLGRNTVLGRATLLLGARASLALLLRLFAASSFVVVSGLSQRSLLGTVGFGGFGSFLTLESSKVSTLSLKVVLFYLLL